MEWFNILAGLAAIADLAFTIWILSRVGRIEAGFIRQARLPVYRSKLRASIKNLKQHQTQKNGSRVRSVLTVCRATLDDMAVHLREERQLNQVSQLISRITELQIQAESDLWNRCGVLIDELEAVQEMLDNSIEEMKWRGRDA